MMVLELTYPFALPPLPYAYDALQPAIDARTLRFHHDKHFADAVDRLNRLLAPYPLYQSWPLNRLLSDWAELPDAIRTDVRRAAGSIHNHTLYFASMAPAGERGQPSGALMNAIDSAFHSPSGFFRSFTAAAKDLYGSGFLFLLCDRDGALHIVKAPNHEVPTGQTPIFCCDLWEHSYYLQYQNRREEYLINWVGLIDWNAASARYTEATQTPPYYPTP